MDDHAGHFAPAIAEHAGLRLDRSAATLGVDSLAWRVCRTVTIRWDGENHAKSPAIPADRNRSSLLCVDPSVRFDDQQHARAIESCFADAIAAGAGAIILPLGALGINNAAAATAWGFGSRKIILAIRRAAEAGGACIALATSDGDRLGKTAVGDWCDLVDRFNSPAIGMSLDLRRCALDSEQAAEAIQTLGGRLRHVYAAETMSAENAERVLRALTAIRFVGTCVLPGEAGDAWLTAVTRVNACCTPPPETQHAD